MMQKIEKIIFGPHSRALLPLWSSHCSWDFQNRRLTVLPWPSSGEDSVLLMQVRELRSYRLPSAGKKRKLKTNKQTK